jgi:rsbT co-antagonist protein RsbR
MSTHTPSQPLQEPSFSPEDLSALREYWTFYEANLEAIQAESMAKLAKVPQWAALIQSMPPAVLEAQQKQGIQNQRMAIVDGNWKPYLAELQAQGGQYAKGGVKFGNWFELIAIFRSVVRNRMLDLARSDLARATKVGDGMNALLDFAMASLGEAYLETKEEIIREQQEAIREISTPVLQVHDRLLIIPVVGVVDTHRARLLTEGLLRSIRDRRAKGVVMDITGVPIVDSKVANHIAQACEAARLMGCRVVLTGISAEIAQTLVTIGAELRGVRTLGDLQSGIEEVERYLSTMPLDEPTQAAHAGAP